MTTEDRTKIDNRTDYGVTDNTQYGEKTQCCDEAQSTIPKYSESMAEPDETTAPVGGGGKWKAVVIGSTAGVLMGAAGAFAGTGNLDALKSFSFGGSNANSSKGNNDDVVPEEDVVVEDDVVVEEVAEFPAATEPVEDYAAEELVSADDFVVEAPVSPSEPIGGVEYMYINVSYSNYDDMSFGDAFAAARAETGGPGGVFVWHGNVYNTYYAEEWEAMTPEQQNLFCSSAVGQANYQNYVYDGHDEYYYEPDHDDLAYDDEVHILGVYEENIEGQNMYVGEVSVAGENIVLVDCDQDNLFDIMIADVDHDGNISDSEFVDISSDGIMVSDFAAASMGESNLTNSDLAGDDMPDYVNDADVSML